jgi:cytochrome P450
MTSQPSVADTTTYPLPPWISPDPKERIPAPALVEAAGPLLASFVHNYQRTGPIYRSYERYSGKEVVVLSGMEANLFVMHHGRAYFGARDFRQKQLEELESDKYLVGMDGDDHYHHRKLQTRGYSRAILDGRYPELATIASTCAARWQPGMTISLYRAMLEIATTQIGATMLNYAFPEKWESLCTYVTEMLTASFSRQGMDESRSTAYLQTKREVMALMDEVIAAHRTQPYDKYRPDVVDALLNAKQEGRTEMDEQALRIGALSVYIAGIQPVAHSCTFMIHALMKHPELLQQLVEEVQHVLADAPLSPDTLREMKKLRYATMEMLRMYPFAPVLQMVALQSFDFQGFYVPAGIPIIISQAVTHYLPELFAHPYRFDIERYGSTRAEHRQSGAFAPYGVGHHICLGAGFSEIQIMVTMATLLVTNRFAFVPDGAALVPGMLNPSLFKVMVVAE